MNGSIKFQRDFVIVTVLIVLITVLKACKQDFVALNDIQKNHSGEKVLRLEGLPWESKENDIRLFFDGNVNSLCSLSFIKQFEKYCFELSFSSIEIPALALELESQTFLLAYTKIMSILLIILFL